MSQGSDGIDFSEYLPNSILKSQRKAKREANASSLTMAEEPIAKKDLTGIPLCYKKIELKQQIPFKKFRKGEDVAFEHDNCCKRCENVTRTYYLKYGVENNFRFEIK